VVTEKGDDVVSLLRLSKLWRLLEFDMVDKVKESEFLSVADLVEVLSEKDDDNEVEMAELEVIFGSEVRFDDKLALTELELKL